jgi:ATP-binding cassette subfamily B multidrug efflux pump
VGETGAGKSTIIRLLARFFDVTGRGADRRLRRARRDQRPACAQQLGIVLQDTFLFNGTVADNIRYGRLDATDAEVMAAAAPWARTSLSAACQMATTAEVGENGATSAWASANWSPSPAPCWPIRAS